jgi:hypothetical protein
MAICKLSGGRAALKAAEFERIDGICPRSSGSMRENRPFKGSGCRKSAAYADIAAQKRECSKP